jgi:hypothetical protein
MDFSPSETEIRDIMKQFGELMRRHQMAQDGEWCGGRERCRRPNHVRRKAFCFLLGACFPGEEVGVYFQD